MSVGISQVNFDAQVLEDEEEAALEKEDQEREQEIRELLNSELDDGLLEDDNVSFSSHDLRSSGYSQDTPYSDDFTEQEHQTILSGHDPKQLIPSERGVFERPPPLITQRAFNFINESGQNDKSNSGLLIQQHNYDQGHQHTDGYNHPGYYEYREKESPFDGQVDEYRENYNQQEGVSNYRTSPNDDHVNGVYEQYGNYHPHHGIQGQFPLQEETHHQCHFPGGKFHVQINGSGADGLYEDYSGYDEGEGTFQPDQNVHDNNTADINAQNHYRMDTHESYQVQYYAQHEPTPYAHNRGSDRHVTKGNDLTNGYSGGGAQDVQLQILYKSRGRKIEELTRKLENQEEEMTKEIRVLNHQIALIKDERDGFSTSLEQSQKMVQTCNTELNSMKGQLVAAYQQINALQGSKEEVISKLHVAETTIDSLNQQLVELSRSESLARAKEQHESVVNAMKRKHEEEVLTLKQKIDEAVLLRDHKHEEASHLRDELVEKAEMINSLTRSLDSSQKQCQEILKSGTMTEINQLQIALQESATARNVAEGQCISLKHELSELKEQVKMYESANRLGVGVGSSIHDSSFGHLTVRNLNKENWSTPKSHKMLLEETVSELRKELEQCLISNKAKRDKVHNLETELNTIKSQLKEQETKAQRMEVIAQEHEVKSQDLARIIQEMENDKKDPDEEHKKVLKDLEIARRNLQECKHNLDEVVKERDDLSETSAELKQQMAQMVAEFDEDKRISIEKCREACLQLHENSKNMLRDQLIQENEQTVRNLRRELEESGEELIRIKECYVQLSEESRSLEEKLKQQFEKEKEMLLSESEAKLVDELRSSLEKRYNDELEKVQGRKEEEISRIKDEFMKEKEQLLQDIEEEKTRLVEEEVTKARKEWSEQHSCCNQTDLDDQIAAARREWIKELNDELEKRLSNAIEEVRRRWDEEQKLKTKEEIERVRAELERAHRESRDQELNKAVELALSHAHADWLKNDEEMRQREIDQAVEVATTNAVAEAKEEWEREIKSQDNLLQTALTHEKLRWKKETELEKSKAVEAAVAIAEVKWYEEEDRKISEAVEQAIQEARDAWKESKQREIAVAVEMARQEWNAKQRGEIDVTLEAAKSQLMKQFEEQKKEAVEKAIAEASLQWEKRSSVETQSEIESLREEIFREFEEQKKVEILETLEEAKEAWMEESEELKREEVNEAMAYLESEYTKRMEEFKYTELKEALEKARQQWTAEELSHREEIVKARLAAAREDWRREVAQSTKEEIERVLTTARENWATDNEDELEKRMEKRTREFEESVREKLQAKHEEEKRKLVEDTLREAETKYKNENMNLQEELRKRKAEESTRDQWQAEKTRLVREHQNQLERMRSEYNSKLKEQRAQVERDLGTKMNNELQKVRNGWKQEQHDARVQLEKQHEQKVRQAVENARCEWEEQQGQELTKHGEDVKRQQELWANERRENQSALEKLKRELASVKKELSSTIEKLKRELSEEREKTQYNSKRRDSRKDAAQTALRVNSGSDTSFSSVDNVSATRGLQELRQYYLDTIAKIRDDVLNHVTQTKASAAKKIRGEVLKERHSTAKKLRKYYLQCLKQLLEEDRVALERNTSPSSTEEKINRMAEALRTLSPNKGAIGQLPHQPEVCYNTQSPRSGVFKVLLDSSKPDVREPRSPSIGRIHGRPRDSGPDGASDTGPIVGKEREFTPILGEHLTVTTKVAFDSSGKYFTPERDLANSPSQETESTSSKDSPPEMKDYHVSSPVLKHTAVNNSESQKNATEAVSAEREKQRTNVMYAPSEHASKQKPLASYKRSAPSPAFSIKSYESDQYSELPTVIRVSRRESSGSKDSNSSIIPTRPTLQDKDTTISPVSTCVPDMLSRPPVENRITKLVTRDKRVTSTSGLPSKPRVDVRTKRV